MKIHAQESAAAIRNRQKSSVIQSTPAAYTGLAESAPDPNPHADTTTSASPIGRSLRRQGPRILVTRPMLQGRQRSARPVMPRRLAR